MFEFEEPLGLVFFPKIFRLKPKEKSTIRIGYKGKWPEMERAYRIFVRELPVKKSGETAIKVAMRISSPVFVIPAVGLKTWEISTFL